MSQPKRRRLRPEARKQEIIAAAERLLERDGARVRVEDVVREAGVAKGTFFVYFPTWDDLLETIRDRMVAALEAAYPMPTEVDGPIDWPAVLDGVAAAFIDFAAARQGIGKVIFHSDFAQRRPMAHNAVTHLSAIIRAGHEAGAFGPVDPDPTARLLFAALDEAAVAVSGGAGRDAILAAMSHLIRRTLAP